MLSKKPTKGKEMVMIYFHAMSFKLTYIFQRYAKLTKTICPIVLVFFFCKPFS